MLEIKLLDDKLKPISHTQTFQVQVPVKWLISVDKCVLPTGFGYKN